MAKIRNLFWPKLFEGVFWPKISSFGKFLPKLPKIDSFEADIKAAKWQNQKPVRIHTITAHLTDISLTFSGQNFLKE